MFSNHAPRSLSPSRMNTECSALSIRFWGSKPPPRLDLTILDLHYRIHLITPKLYTPTMPPTIYFYHGPIPSALHLVFGLGSNPLSRHRHPQPPHRKSQYLSNTNIFILLHDIPKLLDLPPQHHSRPQFHLQHEHQGPTASR
jgi:hypothetical protein